MVNKKKEGLSRLFEIAGQKKSSASVGRLVIGWERGVYVSYLIGRSTGYSMNC